MPLKMFYDNFPVVAFEGINKNANLLLRKRECEAGFFLTSDLMAE
jgi:hypothetical protein